MAFHFHNKSCVWSEVWRDIRNGYSRSRRMLAANQKNGVVQVCASLRAK